MGLNKPSTIDEKIHQDKYLKEKIYFFDQSGKELYTTKSLWLESVLLPDLKANYNNPDNLYNLIVGALNDGFQEFLLDAGKQLYKIDKNIERAGCIYAIILMKNNLLKEAQGILEEAINTIGKTGTLLTNLAKVYAEYNNWEKVENILLEALKIDPNQDNGLDWYLAIHREKNQEIGYIEALNKISQFDNSWRALVYLADLELKNNNIQSAINYYKKATNIERNLPSDILMKISGDLGLNGYIDEIIYIIEPLFKAEIHNFSLANNLIKAYMDKKKYHEAQRILDEYKKHNNPTIKKDILFWQKKLDNISCSHSPE